MATAISMSKDEVLGPLTKELECCVCLEILRDPKIMECMHTFCGNCLKGLVEAKSKTIECPLCRRILPLPNGGIAAMKPNILARNMVEAMSKIDPDNVEFVQEYTVPIPSAPPAEPDEDVQNIDDLSAQEPSAIIKKLCDDLKKEKLKYKNTVEMIKAREEGLDAAVVRAKEKVRQATAKAMSNLNKSQQNMLDQIESVGRERKSTIMLCVADIQQVLNVVEIDPGEMEYSEQKDDAGFLLALSDKVNFYLKHIKENPLPNAKTTASLGFLEFCAADTSNIRIGELLHSEEWLLDFTFGKFGSEIGSFNCARGAAISPISDSMMIAEQLNNRTCAFSVTNGKYLGPAMTGKSAGILDRGDQDVAFYSDGRCLIVGRTSDITIYDKTCGYINTIQTPVRITTCIAIDSTDNIYLGDAQNRLVYVLVNNTVIRKIKVSIHPFYIDVDNKGRLLVSSWKCKRVDVSDVITGATLFTIKSSSVDPLNVVEPWGICFGPDGSIYVCFYNHNKIDWTGTVHKFSSDGDLVGCVASGLATPRGLAFTRDGRLVVVDGASVNIYRNT